MVAKELIEARWKVIVGALLGTCIIIAGVSTYDLMRSVITPEQLQNIPNSLGSELVARLSSFSAYVWGQAFSPSGNNGVILMIVAALLGASFIAGEVSKGTIFLLLSRPLTRDNILLTKYAVGATLLLGMNLLAGAVLAIGAAIVGHPVDLAGLAVSVFLFWLGTLFVLGVSTFFSVLFNDLLRPLALTVVVVILQSLPAFFPHGGDWVLPTYWSSLPAFLGQEFPTKALIISLAAAAIPIVAAVPLFRRQAY
jgi:ABC-type transport system involved in multi-copper enzyme maturation permease subunit